MTAIPDRDLRNHTAEILSRVEAGGEIDILRDNRPVARIIPSPTRRQWIPATEVLDELLRFASATPESGADLCESPASTFRKSSATS